MGLIVCLVGAAGALIAILLIVILCLMGKKAYVPLGLFALCVVAMLVSGQLPGNSATLPASREPGEIKGTAALPDVQPPEPKPVDDFEPVESFELENETKDIDSDSITSIEEIASIIEMILKENYSGCVVTCDDTGITANIWSDGVAEAVTATQLAGGDFTDENWMLAKNATVVMAQSLRELMDDAGLSDSALIVNVLNDLNQEKALLSILNTTIIYDVLA